MRRSFLGLCLGLSVGTVAASASAQETFALNRYEPTPLANDWLRVERPTGLPHLGWAGLATFDWAYRPLVLVSREPDGSRKRLTDVVSDQMFVTPGVALGLFDRVTMHAALPIVLYQAGSGYQSTTTANLGKPETTVLGDLRLGARVRIVGRTEPTLTGKPDLLSLAIGSYLFLPTGDETSWASDGSVRAQPAAMLEVAPSRRVYITGNLGFQFRPVRNALDSRTGAEGFLAIAGGVKLADDRLRIGAELIGGTGLRSSTLFKLNTSPVEGLISATYQLGDGFYIAAGGGAGLSYASGTPAARAVVRLGWTSPWPEEPKKRPRVQKVDDDHDKDGIDDRHDACPKTKGPHSNDPDSNGCPDMDKDGIADKHDACPSEPGPDSSDPQTRGCPPPPPPPDKDKDGIFDKEDACMETPGVHSDDPKRNGCPPDKDKDGVLDDVDACPEDPGPATTDPKTNGCPVKTKFAQVKGSSIVILDKVNFATNSDQIVGNKSFQVLDSVFEILDKTPTVKKVTIEGHTDDKGKPDHNKDLSKRRAESVKAYLVKKGIDPARLETAGFGPDKPIADNKTEVGRAKNRRVEFVIGD